MKDRFSLWEGMDKVDIFFLGLYLGTLGMYIFRLFF